MERSHRNSASPKSKTPIARTGAALMALAGAVALAAATASDATIFALPTWLLIPCIAVVLMASLYLARALGVTRKAALLTGLGALVMAISAGALWNQRCAKSCSWSERLPAPAVVAYTAVADCFSESAVVESVVLDWTGHTERAENLAAHPDLVAAAHAQAQSDIERGEIHLHALYNHELWHETLIDLLESEGVQFEFESSCGLSDAEQLAYFRAYNDAMRQALAARHQEPGYVSRISRQAHASHGNGNDYHPYIL